MEEKKERGDVEHSMALALPDEAIRQALAFADTVTSGALTELGGILGDTIRGWRFKNQIRVLLKSKAYCERKGIEPTVILPDVFVPLIEASATVSHEILSDMFAGLLNSLLDPTPEGPVHPSFVEILKQLSPLDASFLKYAYEEIEDPSEEISSEDVNLIEDPWEFSLGIFGRVNRHSIPKRQMWEYYKRRQVPVREAELSVNNVLRLGLASVTGPEGPQRIFLFEILGLRFMAACIRS